jgi:hypothetical protein
MTTEEIRERAEELDAALANPTVELLQEFNVFTTQVRNAAWDDPAFQVAGEPVPLQVFHQSTEALIGSLQTYLSLEAHANPIPVGLLDGNIEAWRQALAAI